MFRTLSATSKLYFLVSVLCLFVVGMGYYGTRQLKRLKRETQSLYEDRVKPLEQLTSVRYAYLADLNLLGTRAGHAQTEGAQLVPALETSMSYRQKAWHDYKQTYLTSEEKVLSAEVERLMQAADGTLRKLESALKGNNAAAADALVNGALNNDVSAAVSRLHALVQLQIEVSRQLYKDSSDVYDATVKQFYRLIAICLLFAFVLSVLIVTDTRRLIRRLKESGKEIASSQEQFRAAIAYAGDAILIMDDTFTIKDVNNAACELSGFSRQEMIGMKSSDFTASEVELQSHLAIQEQLKMDIGSVHERLLKRKDGSIVTTEVNVRPLKGAGYIAILRDITERKKAAEQQYLLASIISQSTDAIISNTTGGIITSWNQGAAVIFGYDQQVAIGKHISILLPADCRDQWELMVNGTDGRSHQELQCIKEDGRPIDISMTVSPIRDKRGNIIGSAIIARDVTESKKIAAALAEREYQYTSLFNQALETIVLFDNTGKIVDANRSASKLTGYNREQLLQMRAEDLVEAEDLRNAPIDYGPMEVGSISVRERTLRTRSGATAQVEISRKQISENRILIIARDITDLRKAQHQIVLSESTLRSAFDHSATGMVLLSIQGMFLKTNIAFVNMIGYSEQELMEKRFSDITYHEDRGLDSMLIERALKGELDNFSLEKRYVRKTGAVIWVRLNSSLVRDKDNKPLFFVTQVEDITDIKRTAQLLRESELKFRGLAEKSMVGVYIIQNGKFAYVNPRLAEIFGYEQDELINTITTTQLVDAHSVAYVTNSIASKIEGEMEYSHYEAKGRRKNGEVFWMDVYSSTTLFGGEKAVIGSVLDINDRKIAQQELAESEDKFRSLVEQTMVGVYVIQDDKFVYANPGLEKISGYSLAELTSGSMFFKDLVHTSDLEKVAEKYASRTNGAQHSDQYTIRAIRKDGAVRHIEIIASAIVYKGEPALIGTIMDITDRIEEEIRTDRAVTAAQEHERLQIGMELHDNVKQILAGSVIYLDMASKTLDDKQRAAATIADSIKYIREAIAELRRLSHRLAPSVDSDMPLAEKIQELIRNMNFAQSLAVDIDVAALSPIDSNVQLAVYRIIQEQFSNILKYADASRVKINISDDEAALMMSIADDGVGFDAAQKKDGIGLENIRRRAQALGGSSAIQSAPGKGCVLEAQIPLAQ